MNKCRILHITKDDKFFDGVFGFFEADGRFDNKALLEVEKVDGYKFTRIKNQEKVKLVNKKNLIRELENGIYDAVFFYSLAVDRYEYVSIIPKGKAVIWWTWGSDIYHSFKGMKPFIELPIHKPLTAEIMNELYGGIKETIKNLIKKHVLRHFYTPVRKRMLRKIDYFQPVLPIEFQFMKKLEGFHAKEFYYPLPDFYINNFPDIRNKPSNGGIIIGHSQNPDDNHLDVWNDINKFIPDGRKVVIPINYIGYDEYAKTINKKIKSDRHDIMFLKQFMPKDDYFKLVDTCSYAVYGMIRQQAIANVDHCLRNGIKLFFYQDSIVYRYLKDRGYVVFTIESINKDSFNLPLSDDEIAQNKEALIKATERKSKVRNDSLNELCCLFNENN